MNPETVWLVLEIIVFDDQYDARDGGTASAVDDLIWLAVAPKIAFSDPLVATKDPMTPNAIKPAIRPYSMAVAPDRSFLNRSRLIMNLQETETIHLI